MPSSPFFRRATRYPNVRPVLALFLGLLLLAVGFLPLTRAAAGSQSSGSLKTKDDAPRAEFVPGEVLVRFRENAPALKDEATSASVGGVEQELPLFLNGRKIPAQLESFEGSEIVRGLRLARVQTEDTLSAIDALNARPDVLYAEPNYIWRVEATPDDTRFPQQYALPLISAPQAWDRTTGSSGVVVAVLDGGVDVNHLDLKDNIWTNPGEAAGNGVDDDGNGLVDDVNGWDFTHNDKTVFDNEDGDDHATHVAGTIGARGNNGFGVTGINWQVSIMSVKVLSKGSGSVSNFIKGYNYVRQMRERGVNVRVMNNSYGGTGKSLAAQDAIRALNGAGVLFVAAAGNNAFDNFGLPHYPSNYDSPNIVAVASTNSSDQLSSFSNFGERVVSMGAPGSNILSTFPNSTYSTISGTSMATPHVAGAAALALSANPNLSVQNLRGVVAFTGDKVSSLDGRTTTGRRLNVNAAVISAQENDTTAPAPVGNLQIIQQFDRQVNLRWNGTGDDGNSGEVADYDIFFVFPNGTRLLLPAPVSVLSSAPDGFRSAVVNLPFQTFSGTLEVRAYDNAGNFSTVSVPVNLQQNRGSDPYVVSLGAPSGLSTGGTPLNINGDDTFKASQPIGFGFPFFGETFGFVTVSSNGTLYFGQIPQDSDPVAGVFGLDADSNLDALTGQKMIAGLWDDLRTDKGGNVFMVQPDSTRTIFRWEAVTFDTPLGPGSTRGEQPVNFEIELRNDGTIITRYGAGQSAPTNTRLIPVVGISGGMPAAYVVDSHTSKSSLINLTNAQTVTFAPRPLPSSTIEISAPSTSAGESTGSVNFNVTRTGDTGSAQSVNISTSNGTADANSDYNALSGTLDFAPGETSKTVKVGVVNDTLAESNETINVAISNPTNNASLGSRTTTVLVIVDDDSSVAANTVGFANANLNVAEGAGHVQITVNRAGDPSSAATVFYQTNDGTASERSDYSASLGTLRFAAGEASKTLDLFISDDKFDEADETFTLALSDPVHSALGGQSTMTVQITDNDAASGESPVKNDSFDAQFFVKQHYVDFFNREADAPGLAFWTSQITECETRPEAQRQECREIRRINVSAAFFVSGEFQQTGFLVYLTHHAAFNTGEQLRLKDFMADTQSIGRGVVIGQPGADAQLEANKQRFFQEFVSRPQFVQVYQPLSNQSFISELSSRTGGGVSASQQSSLVSRLNGGQMTRADALREIVENSAYGQSQYSRAFVLMQYFGYLRRNPNDAPEPGLNFNGYNFWLGKLNQFGGNYITSEMVKGFITSTEYQQRFGL